MSNVLIRPARLEDKPDVLEISATVWNGHDYIPAVWDSWVEEDPSLGFLIAGEIDGKVVALQHTSLQPGSVAWMEGIRVHPDYRQHGIAKSLLRRALETARELGYRRSRLSTAQVNQASSAIALGNDFQEIAQFSLYSAPAERIAAFDEVLPKPTEADLQAVREAFGDTATLIADGWTAYDVPGQRSVGDYGLAAIRSDPTGIKGVALARPEPERDRVALAYVNGTEDSIRELGLRMRDHAANQGFEEVAGTLRESPRVRAGLERAGYKRNPDLIMLVYERPL
jgi:ribosomal protein S18 acetylase RimI-like enzyme